MFWTLAKILVFVAVVIGLAFGAGQLMDSGQTVGLRIVDMEFELGPVQAAIALGLFVLAVWLGLKLLGLLVSVLRFMNGDETALRRFFAHNREKRGLDALLAALLAQASGDGKTAVAKAEKAHALLNRPVITSLLIAQSAELKGNRPLAEEHYKRLLEDTRSRFVGVQGLIRAKLEEGDTDKARKLAQKALDMQPAHEATQNTLLKLQTDAEDWQGARKTLQIKKSSGHLPRDVYRRRDAILALQNADALAATDNMTRAREAAIEANRLSPDLIPAAVAAARALVAQGKGGYAAKAIKKAWKVQPHPELAAAFAAIEPDETPLQRVSRFRKLLALHPDHAETRLLKAELLIGAEDFPAARRALGDLATTAPTVRALAIMAAIERGEGADDAVVRGWLARALTASRGPQWVCSNCQHVHAGWQAICDNCGAFDTLEWRDAPDSAGPSATQTELLPLIVGSLPSRPAAPDDADVVAGDVVIDDAEEAGETPPPKPA
ncbi:heme biosynthesis protein HemY [Roseinatronobacter alkalisoli]|uniref:Heme biosynthesis HemY N-terminal domain-containing protein n=1 Tax=Roseinatronobacter alkalisoli TaxID=3028235 RepID=A0ABT5TBY3_9RHOB|nr:heme biosynthesis HemY N-terminal domain-containing protein [Roseinatronobacter sp. HJB301]MDD7971433.1 heme biosynthesis HemY N-terminal domain-containing protein [Roseinatronobacter sp. HJB301]